MTHPICSILCIICSHVAPPCMVCYYLLTCVFLRWYVIICSMLSLYYLFRCYVITCSRVCVCVRLRCYVIIWSHVVPPSLCVSVSDAGAPVYLYQYHHAPQFLKEKRPSFVGADHGDEIFLVMGFCFTTTHDQLTGE